jgi:hypothetical protein
MRATAMLADIMSRVAMTASMRRAVFSLCLVLVTLQMVQGKLAGYYWICHMCK